MNLKKEVISFVRPKVERLLELYDIDGIAFVPPTVRRERQFMKVLQRQLALSVRTVDLFDSMKNLAFDAAVAQKVIELRQTSTIKLPDAIIAATALVNGAELWTHNLDDFKSMRGLIVVDPLSDAS